MEGKIKNTGITFHVKAIFLFIVFAVYVGLELSLNLLLIDLYAQPVEKVFVEHAESVVRLDLFGRTLSSFGIALAIITFFPLWRFVPKLDKEAAKKCQEQNQTVRLTKGQRVLATWLVRPLVLIVLWLVLIPSLRLVVDAMVHNTSNDGKLSAVRAVIYKEGYLAGVIKIEDFEQFNAIVEDKQRRDLVVALIPSLAYASKNFNQLIEQNMEKLADTFLSNHQEQRFAQQGLPKLRQFDEVYRAEYKLYQQTNKQYQLARKRLTDRNAILAEQQQLIAEVNSELQSHWDAYVAQYSRARDSFKELSKNKTLRKVHHQYKDRHRARGCDTSCQRQVEAEHANYLNNLEYENGRGLGIKVLPKHILFTALGTEGRILTMLTSGRKHWLKLVYAVGEHEQFEKFVVSEEARKLLIKKFKEKGVLLPEAWQTNDVNAISQFLYKKYEQQAANLWQEYKKNSQFDITDAGLDRIDFATHDTVNQYARRTLGQYYIRDFSPGLAESVYVKKWLAQQDNISFIRMVSSTAAVAAFAPGGTLYDIGNDAVKLAVILPFSVVLSFVAIIMLFWKFSGYLKQRSKAYLLVLCSAGALVFALPVVHSLSKDNTYGEMMSSFAKDFSKNDPFEYAKMSVFGFILDVENGLFEHYRELPFIQLVASKVFNQQLIDPQSNEQVVIKPNDQVFDLINGYDDFVNEEFAWLPSSIVPSVLGGGEIRNFDANITILKRDHSIGAFLGINLSNGKVSKVTMPNFLDNKDLALLAEQRYFYNPDVKDLSQSFIDSYEDGDYLLTLANGQFMRESALSKIEKAMVKLLNKQDKLLHSIKDLNAAGYKNLVLVQMNRSESYQCFATPTINSVAFAQAVAANNLNFQQIDNCQGVL